APGPDPGFAGLGADRRRRLGGPPLQAGGAGDLCAGAHVGPGQPEGRGDGGRGAGGRVSRPARLLAVGRLKPGPEAALFTHYNARLRPPLAVTEIPEARGSAAEVRRREGAALLAALPEAALLVALDLGGTAPSSEALAALVERWEGSGRPLCFAIGGAEGL